MAGRNRRVGGAIVALVLLAGIASGCGGDGSDAGRLRSAIDELASVGGPDGRPPADVSIVGCDDHAEMPAGYASYNHPLDPHNVDAFNAELAEVGRWYLPRWKALGWKADKAMPGSVTKQVDGTRLRAEIDVGKGTGYAIVVSKDGGALCG